MSILHQIHRYIFSKRVQKQLSTIEREHKFVSYKTAKTVMILFESDYSEKNPEIRKIIKTLREDGKKVVAWGFVNKKEVTTAILPDFRILHHKDIDFTQKPNSTFMHELEDMNFDLLLDLTNRKSLPLQYLGLYATAFCKSGQKGSSPQIYDFVINLEKVKESEEASEIDLDASAIYNHIIFYLKSIQTSD